MCHCLSRDQKLSLDTPMSSMMPDSTQGGPEKKLAKTDDKKKNKKSAKNRKADGGSRCKAAAAATTAAMAAVGLEELVGDRASLLEQLFQSAGSQEEVRRGLPHILQDIALEELKKLCLEELQRMTDAEVLRILAGEKESQPFNPAPDSTSADNEPVELTHPKSQAMVVGTAASAVRGCLSPSPSESLELFPATEEMDLLVTSDNQTTTNSNGEAAADATSTIEKQRAGQQALLPELALVMNQDSPDLASNLTKMRMEILELELRARAIKALLQSQRGSEEEETTTMVVDEGNKTDDIRSK